MLLSRIAAGEPGALGEICRRYGDVVLGMVHGVLGDWNQAQAATAIAFHAIWRKAIHYRPELGSARSWVVMTARSSLIEQRHSIGHPVLREAGTVASATVIPAVAERRVTNGGNGASVERMEYAISSLPPEDQAVLALAFWSGRSQGEIAKAMGLPLPTVRIRLHRGMTALRDALQADRNAS